MTEQLISNLITAIAEGDTLAVDNNFNAIMSNKIADRLESMRVDVAATMFGEAVDMGQADSSLRKSGSKSSNYKVVDSTGKTISTHSNQSDAIRQSLKNDDHRVVKEDYSLEDFSIEELQDFIISEDFEQLDEISKQTLSNYVSQAGHSLVSKSTDKASAAAHSSIATMAGRPEEAEKQDAERADIHKKMMKRSAGIATAARKLAKEEFELDEASYSAKAAHAGKDIGKKGKNFEKIAKSAAEKYGSEEAGERVAGAVLANLRKK